MISPERLFYAAGALRRASVALQDLSDRFDAEAREASTLREAELAAKRAYSSPTLREVFPPNARILGVEDPADGTLTEAMMSEPCVGRSHPKDDGTRATDPADARAAECAYEAIRWYGRRKVRREIKNVHRRLIAERPDDSLARRIRELFPNK